MHDSEVIILAQIINNDVSFFPTASLTALFIIGTNQLDKKKNCEKRKTPATVIMK